MSADNTITPEDIIAAAAARPEKWIEISIAGKRSAAGGKNKCGYMDITIILADGSRRRPDAVKIPPVKLAGGVKAEREYGISLTFKRSSTSATGSRFGEAMYLFAREVERYTMANKGMFRKQFAYNSIVQEGKAGSDVKFDDPIIRVAIKMDFDKKFILTPIKRVIGLGHDMRLVDAQCTTDNVHTILTAGAIVSGSINMNALTASAADTRMSVPTKATSLYVRAAAAFIPEIVDLLTEEERAAMATEDDAPPAAAMAAMAITPAAAPIIDDMEALRRSAGLE